jgi:serine/threonine-protein kinase
MPARYIDALIASHRGDLAGAIEKAEEAARETPWLFEARLLQGHLEFENAVKLYLGGNGEKAAEKASQADRHYEQAQRIAASSVDSYLGRCGVAGLVIHMGQHGLSTDIEAAYRRAEESCSQALVVESDKAEAYRLYSEAVRSWGSVAVRDRNDPGTAYGRAADLAERAVRLSGEDSEALLALADTFLDRAWWESRTGKDPRGAVDRAVATYERALALDPRNVTGANNMGMALLLRSRFEAAHRVDASASLDRCIASFQTALGIDPVLSFAFRNLWRAALERADEQSRRGLDPAPGLQQVVRFVEQLNGDRALPNRVEALAKLRARLGPPQP